MKNELYRMRMRKGEQTNYLSDLATSKPSRERGQENSASPRCIDTHAPRGNCDARELTNPSSVE
jgi:hypothetical protein